MITKKTINDIVETSRIEEVVGDFVNLKKRGANLLGLCPFHNEKTPSFTVSPAKNIYKCFGCGKGGDPVNFIMEHESVSYPESLKYLAEKYGIEIEETQTSQAHKEEQQKLDSLYVLNQYARDFYHQQLLQTDIGKSVGLSYLKNRGFTDETIEKFGLGYAPKDKDAFTQNAKRNGFKGQQLKKLGLTSKYDSDFFRDRVMFTIHSVSGKVIGFGGRIMSKNVKAPKYVNTPETEVYNKSKVLYGAYFAKRAIRKSDECILVEGYTDVVSLHQGGIENVVASSGTSLTVEQIRMVKRYTQNMKILYDGDSAGVKAALRGLDLVLEQDMNVKVVMLPEGEDPDSYLQSVGSEAFKEYIESQANDFILFKSELLFQEASGDPVRQAAMIKDIVASIAKIPDPLKRSLYIKECGHLMKVEEEILMNEVNQIVTKSVHQAEDQRKKDQRQYARKKAAEKAENLPSDPGNFPPDAPPPYLMEDEAYDIDGGAAPPPQSLRRRPAAANSSEYQEKDIIRLLITYGGQQFNPENNDITVAHFILSNIEDVLDDFDNDLYQRVAQECLDLTIDGTPITPEYFIQHEDKDFRRLAIDVLQPEFEMSPQWLERHDLPLRSQPMPDANFNLDSISSIYWFKLRKLDKLIERNKASMKKAIDEKTGEEDVMKAMKIHQKLMEIRKDIALKLNTVIVR